MLFLCCFGLVSPQFVVLVWCPLNLMVPVWFAPYVSILFVYNLVVDLHLASQLLLSNCTLTSKFLEIWMQA